MLSLCGSWNFVFCVSSWSFARAGGSQGSLQGHACSVSRGEEAQTAVLQLSHWESFEGFWTGCPLLLCRQSTSVEAPMSAHRRSVILISLRHSNQPSVRCHLRHRFPASPCRLVALSPSRPCWIRHWLLCACLAASRHDSSVVRHARPALVSSSSSDRCSQAHCPPSLFLPSSLPSFSPQSHRGQVKPTSAWPRPEHELIECPGKHRHTTAKSTPFALRIAEQHPRRPTSAQPVAAFE